MRTPLPQPKHEASIPRFEIAKVEESAYGEQGRRRGGLGGRDPGDLEVGLPSVLAHGPFALPLK